MFVPILLVVVDITRVSPKMSSTKVYAQILSTITPQNVLIMVEVGRNLAVGIPGLLSVLFAPKLDITTWEMLMKDPPHTFGKFLLIFTLTMLLV